MYDLKFLQEVQGELGSPFVSLDFTNHPAWQKLTKEEILTK